MATRRGFIGALFGGAAATAGGLLIPNAVAAREKIEVSTTPEMVKSLRQDDGEIIVCDAATIPDEFFETRVNLYRRWWAQASPAMWRMPERKYNAFIDAHGKVNRDFGIVAQLEEGPHKELDVGMLTPYPGEPWESSPEKPVL